MMAEFRHQLRRLRGRIIGWSIGLGLYGLMMAMFYDSVLNMEGFQEMLANYPKELMAFVGDMASITTPAGYMDTYYFSYMSMIIGIFIVGAAAGLLAGYEEQGLLDLVLAHPISRRALFWGRALALVLATVIILLVGWLTWAVPSGGTEMNLTWLEFLLPFLPLLAILLLFGALTMLLGLVLPSSRLAAMISAGLLVANFLMLGLARLNVSLEPLIKFTPLYYYQGGQAVNGLNWGWIGGLVLGAVVLTAVAWLLFERREIRVGGERSWNLGRLRTLVQRG
jgi:ABC-2 type transport system permease protein